MNNFNVVIILTIIICKTQWDPTAFRHTMLYDLALRTWRWSR